MKSKQPQKQRDKWEVADVDYRVLAKDKLKQLAALRTAVCNLEQRIASLDDMIGWRKAEEQQLSLRAEREELRTLCRFRRTDVQRTEQALDVLTQQQRVILDRFYIHRSDYYIERLCEELGYERRAVYYHHDAALRDFALALYGMTDG